MRLGEPPQALDTTPAHSGRLMTEVFLEDISDCRSLMRGEALQVMDSLWCEQDPVLHSSQILARFRLPVKWKLPLVCRRMWVSGGVSSRPPQLHDTH